MKFQYSALLALAASVYAAPPSPSVKENTPSPVDSGCASAVTLDPGSNPFKKYTLHPNVYYRKEVEAAVKAISDSSLAASAAKVADVGSFLWMYVLFVAEGDRVLFHSGDSRLTW